MSRLPRFYLAQNPRTDNATPRSDPSSGKWSTPILLDKQQSYHLKKVLRLKAPDKIELFDNKGISYLGEINSFRNDLARIKILEKKAVWGTGHTLEITLATALPKGKRMDFLVEKLAEMGLKRLVPLETARSVVRLKSRQKVERWCKIAIEAAKQSGQNRVLEITESVPLNKIIPEIRNYDLGLIASPESRVLLKDVITRKPSARRILYLIGPEGDFTPEEVVQAKRAGFESVLLPVNAILRVETAALVTMAMLFYAYQET